MDTARSTHAYVGLGANLGPAAATVRAAIAALADVPATSVLAVSSLYGSAPIDSAGDDYINAVVALQTGLSAAELLAQLQALEARFGRERPYRNAPRTLDLDLLLFGATVMDTPLLTLPHPRLHERAFVLQPLAEIEPGLEIPGWGPLRHLLPTVAAQRVIRLAE
jgi:2-amino-4-hydroxy-6-hydroxymethyldihydropteridine diphosphokinase